MCPDCESKLSFKKVFVVLTIVIAGVFVFDHYASASNDKPQSSNKNEVIVYKNAGCGCCSKWAEHMRENGFKVVEKPVDNLDEIKNSLGVPKENRSCHTAVLGKYVFEGHIPAKSIRKFLKNNKNLKGLVVPDMPMGSPGMDYGNHKGHFTVMSFDKNGKTSTFEKF
ncbi:MAG: hypothetical protein COW01_15825 [Bdellovibrionales bacterium CG12_big_fil_rev_8_21_14_0_65_38_15]|jgi:hypothetical protein|nr:MAG: hypothetical protein COW79_14990 [Bdellovibrionales bacterium CG22_combo_CG10-13_8_21_14_all_38_13]PIQ52437.1 MAG: hypothetical protein COW01_15825 [Bdellovibrionales bacterium CG12_big_fil_rev_8_21_14_0_65_38_15]PIR29475.1 MAG: hypothetical protein COV38_10365 [Bdellovibrionales bacterium CG11_big_fil_rev_8_21_14_0_20_38_13]